MEKFQIRRVLRANRRPLSGKVEGKVKTLIHIWSRRYALIPHKVMNGIIYFQNNRKTF